MRASERVQDSRERSVSQAGRSSQEVAGELSDKFKTQARILRWALFGLILLVFIWLCKLIAGSQLKPVSNYIKQVASKRNCDEELKALTSVHKFDGSSSDSTIDVSIPKES